MTRKEAIALLKPYSGKRISKVYDDLTDLENDAIFTLVPDFEYPDWDNRRVCDLWINGLKF